MKDLAAFIIAQLPAIICATFAGLLALHQTQGWGWFLLVSALVCVTRANID